MNTPKAYRIWTNEGSKFICRFDPKVEKDGVLYGHSVSMGYSVAAERHLKIVGLSSAPEVGGTLVISDKPWHTEIVNGEEVHHYAYERITNVEDITNVLQELKVEED